MVELASDWLGLRLSSPLVVGASPLADDIAELRRLVEAGAGAVVLRSLFEEQIVAEQLAAFRYLDAHVDTDAEARSFLPDSDVFSLGPEPALAHLRKVRAALDVPVIASLNGTSLGGWTDIARQQEEAGADAIELNLYEIATRPELSADDIESRQQQVVSAVADAVAIPVAVKLSPFYTSLPGFAARLEDAGARGLVLFNRFYQPDIALDTLGLDRRLVPSTPAELPLRLHALAILSGRSGLSLAASGGVHSGTDAAKAILCGASAVQLVSALLDGGPERLRGVHRELASWLEGRGYRRLDEARGAMSLDKAAAPETWERLNYVRVLRGWQPRPTGR